MNNPLLINDRWILAQRGLKNPVQPYRPYAWMVEKERTASGKVEDTAIIFLTNRECPYHCLMCDLWKNTTDETVPIGSIPTQIETALNHVGHARHIKLYNSGSFFDPRAIPEEDYGAIAALVKGFDTVIVESHPRLVNERVLHFRDMLGTEVEVAMGLETVNPEAIRILNKRMTLEDFGHTVGFLGRNSIRSRAFILLRPPFHTEEEGVYWAERSVDFAYEAGVECCTVIPVRAGNGAMNRLQEEGHFSPPRIRSLEAVQEYGIGLRKGRMFADTWDLGMFSDCEDCLTKRTERLVKMNLEQAVFESVTCHCNQ
jgi:radical SAM enzyme (TIGR01210 family)